MRVRHNRNGHTPAGNIGTSIQLNKDRIFQWRLDQGLSQKDAAASIGIATMTYRRCETGVGINWLNAAKVARHLDIPLDELRAG